MTSWDPDQYARYRAYRARPANDLLAQIPHDLDAHEIWDLGCGLGEQAVDLKRRFPQARVHGLDSSASMLEKARALDASIDWVLADVTTWTPETPPDLIFSNAALHWLPDHAALFPRLMRTLRSGGVFACQMPLSYDAPQHVTLRETAANGPWSGRLEGIDGVKRLGRPEDYYAWLSPLSAGVDVWTTTYLHVLEGDDPVFEWMLGSGSRPFLEALTEPERTAFSDAYRAALSRAFPKHPDGATLLPFQRLFLTARRS
ncbi:MAG TPA: methyltransferase domain-containing protein [Caulobacteraceae bacterium]